MSPPGRPKGEYRKAQPEGKHESLRGRGETIALVMAALALAATFLRPTAPVPLPQVEAVLVFDITQSMNVADMALAGRPASRLARARAEVERLLPMLPCGSRIGLGVFTDYRSLLLIEPIEVCEHLRELVHEVRRIDGGMAWEGNSEVAKGVNSGMQMVRLLDSGPALVFVTDGHEAPPISPHYRPTFSVPRGQVRGLVLGVGGDVPVAIPRFDRSGQRLGVWEAKEVMQVDPRSLGRAGNREAMVDTEATTVAPDVGATPGAEHLSSLREGYLQRLAAEAGLGYQRLGDAKALYLALSDATLSRSVTSSTDLRPLLGALALLLLLVQVIGRGRSDGLPDVPPSAASTSPARAPHAPRQRDAPAATRPHR
jgi:mxaL protein